MKRLGIVALLFTFAFVSLGAPAKAQSDCSRAVVFTLPGVTWEMIEDVHAPGLMSVVAEGATGSMSVRTISARTSYAAGFATLGAGSRVDASRFTGAPRYGSDYDESDEELFVADVEVAGLSELKADALEAGYDAVPGALATALGDIPVTAIGNSDLRDPPPAPAGYGRWALLAAMDAEGIVDSAATGPSLLKSDSSAAWDLRTDPQASGEAVDDALGDECGVTFIDPGDLARVDERALVVGDDSTGPDVEDQRAEAIVAADVLLRRVVDQLDFERDLLLVVSPTSPWFEEEGHLGIAVVRGPGFEAGQTLQSASTRRTGIVTLPDVAPTILEHQGLPAIESP